jgi:uncharacterized protein (TIGR02001 family)
MLKKSFKKIIPAFLAAMVITTPAVQAESPHEFSANVAITTDYRFRGISQTNEDPAIQGGFDYAYAPYSFYAGVWASSLEFGLGAPDNASTEMAASQVIITALLGTSVVFTTTTRDMITDPAV